MSDAERFDAIQPLGPHTGTFVPPTNAPADAIQPECVDFSAVEGALRRPQPAWIAVAEAYERLTVCIPACFFGGGKADWKALGDAMEQMRVALQRYRQWANAPDREKWIFENPEVLAKIEKGMEQSRNGESVERSFAQCANDDEAEKP